MNEPYEKLGNSNTQPDRVSDNLPYGLSDVQTAVLAASLTYYGQTDEKYEKYKQSLVTQLAQSENKIVQGPIPFCKNGVKMPAGYIIETEKEVLICYHGTRFSDALGSGKKEILHDTQFVKSKMKFGAEEVSVHSGFKKEFEASKDSLYTILKTINPSKPLHITGHSLGGAVAQIAALDLSLNQKEDVKKVTTFGGAVVFTKSAANLYNRSLGENTFRIINTRDPIPRIIPLGYLHTGKIIKVSSPVGRHVTKAYRDIADKKITTNDLNTDQNYNPENSIINDYVKPIMNMSKAAYLAAQSSVIKIKNLLRKSKRSDQTVSSSPRSVPPGSKHDGRGI